MSSSEDMVFSCRCGSLSGHLAAAGIKPGARILCHCADCRAVELYHNCDDPAGHGVDLFQVSPDMVTIDRGAEHLSLMQLSPRGLYRWYAGCCGTPLFNGLRNPKMPFMAIRSTLFQEPDRLGRVIAEAFVPQAGKPPIHKNAGRMTFKLASRMIAAWVSGRWRLTPLFDMESRSPKATPKVLSKDERRAPANRAKS